MRQRSLGSGAALAFVCSVACAADSDDGAASSDAATTSDTGGEAAAVYVVANRIMNPSGRSVVINAVPSLEPRTIELGSGIEVSGRSRVQQFREWIFVFDGESGEVVRYLVDESLAFVPDGRFSMSGVGVVQFRSFFAWLGPERAYYIDLDNEQVVVFSPTAMQITGVFELPDLEREFGSIAGGTVVVNGDEVVMPVSWTDPLMGTLEPVSAALVLSASEDESLRIVEDSRCVVSGPAFLQDEQVYVLGDSGDGAFDVFLPQQLPAPCLLRLDRGATSFDPSFLLDMRATTGAPHVSGIASLGDGTFVTRIYDSDFDASTLDNPAEYFQLEVWRYAVVNLAAGTSTAVDTLPLSGISFSPFVVEDSYYVPILDEDAAASTLYRLVEGMPLPSLSVQGDAQFLQRLR